MKKLIVGNWKMNGTVQGAKTLITALINGISVKPDLMAKCEFVVCPPNLFAYIVRHAITTVDFINLGAQDCGAEIGEDNAHTGDTSAGMLRDSACRYVILGHSERRLGHNEDDAMVAAKVGAAHQSGLKVILCVGETQAQRKAGQAESVVKQQLMQSLPEQASAKNTVIAYEPVWSIGSGDTPSPGDIQAMHNLVRQTLVDKGWDPKITRVLYGGSVKPDNARVILNVQGVDGTLVGGSSLDADAFIAIAQSVETV